MRKAIVLNGKELIQSVHSDGKEIIVNFRDTWIYKDSSFFKNRIVINTCKGVIELKFCYEVKDFKVCVIEKDQVVLERNGNRCK